MLHSNYTPASLLLQERSFPARFRRTDKTRLTAKRSSFRNFYKISIRIKYAAFIISSTIDSGVRIQTISIVGQPKNQLVHIRARPDRKCYMHIPIGKDCAMPDSLWQTCQFYSAIVRKRYKEAADAGRRIEMGFASFPVKILFKEFGASFQTFYINRNVCQLHPSAPPDLSDTVHS